MILYEKRKKRKARKPNATERQLQADWERMMKQHAQPLVKGAIANGVKVKPKISKKEFTVLTVAERAAPKSKDLPIPLSQRQTGTVPVVDVLADAKHALKARVGISFNKGGLQYLSDDELAEQRTGSHKRR